MDLSLIVFTSGIVFGGACAILASNKHRDPLGWFALGFLFSIIALIVIATISPASRPPTGEQGRTQRRRAGSEFAADPKDPERPWLG